MIRSLELKNVKVHPDMSEETTCYSATIYVDGKKVGFAKNNGHGGEDLIDIQDRATAEALEDFAVAECERLGIFKKMEVIDDTTKYHIAVECLFGKMLADHEEEKWLRRQARTKILFRVEGDEEGAWRTLTSKGGVKTQADRDSAYAYLDSKFGARLERVYGRAQS